MAPDGPAGRDSGTGSRQTVQAALVVLCVLGLVLAALAAPSLGAGGGSGESGGGGGSGGDARPDGGGGGGVGVGPGLYDLLRWLLPEERSEPTEPRGPTCSITVEPEPVPGRTVTLTVRREREPVEGALVRVEGERVGRTDADGEVEATVPYVRRLSVVATFPDDSRCRATTDTGTRDAGVDDVAGIGPGVETGVALGVPGLPVAQQSTPDVSGDGRNVSQTYEVEGEVGIGVRGRPDPGATVTVVAHVGTEPMRNATVSVDGRTVGRTDGEGRYALSVPADGTRRLRLRVERGEFAGERTVVVRVLTARVVPVGLVSFPGSPVAVRARLGAEPTSGATVTRDGRRLGETDADGGFRFPLPPAPTGTVTVRANGQTATAGLWLPYAATAVVVGFPALVLAGAVALAYARGATPGRVGRRVGGVLRRLGAGLLAVALWVATGIGRVLDWLLARGRAAWARLAGLLGRARENWRVLPRAVARLLVALPRRGLSVLVAGWRWVRALPRRLWRQLRGQTTAESAAGLGSEAAPPLDSSTFDLREAWRTVARRVVPAGWRTRTPGEVVRAAAASGLPREPVERLATVFEEVEYGGRPLSPERRERARTAVETLLAHWREATTEEGEEA